MAKTIIIGTVDQFSSQSSAMQASSTLRREISMNDGRLKRGSLKLSELIEHYRQRELRVDNTWKTHSTKVTYEGYIKKWILPRWRDCTLDGIKAGEVELCLRHLPLARSSCAKIRDLMSVLFNHAIRHDLYDRNPIRWVRQSAKRRKIPVVLSVAEIQALLHVLSLRERTLVLLDAGTGLRMSELFGLKWKDIDFSGQQISIVRSIVMQVTGPCKTEASQKPIPLDPYLAEALQAWLLHAPYINPDDWLFANPAMHGKQPYWGQPIMRNIIRPAARAAGIMKPIGWHSFRHIYSSLLKCHRGKHQSHARIATSRLSPGHARHVHTGDDSAKT